MDYFCEGPGSGEDGYYHGTNRLWRTAKDDGDNYQYDPIGNLTKDLKEVVDITWNPYEGRA